MHRLCDSTIILNIEILNQEIFSFTFTIFNNRNISMSKSIANVTKKVMCNIISFICLIRRKPEMVMLLFY